MTQESDAQQSAVYSVLTFDICSSTDILEDLHRTGSTGRWRDLHIKIKEFLHDKAASFPYRLYNFTGDGWILLFSQKVGGQKLMAFLEELCKTYASLYATKIRPVLETHPEVLGMTFGMDRGQLIKIHMNGRDEFVGRPINVACRLQSANCHLQHVVEIGRDGLLDALFALATYSRKKMAQQERSIHDHRNRL